MIDIPGYENFTNRIAKRKSYSCEIRRTGALNTT